MESLALDAEILGIVERWHTTGEMLSDDAFNDLALRLFEYQLRYNEPYGRYCSRLGMTGAPNSWERIPAVPAPAFRDAALTTFDPAAAALAFHTSGTTTGMPGRHYMETASLYDAALLAGFDRFVLEGGSRLRYLNFVPNPAENPNSSLGYMMARVSKERGDGRVGWYLHDNELLVDAFLADAERAIEHAEPVCIAATSFALVHLLDALEARNIRHALPAQSKLMVTGGFKGRTRVVERKELFARLCEAFTLTDNAIISEYGMTELTSQYYSRGPHWKYQAPPWLSVRVVGPERTTLPLGEVGSLLHVDLANRSSCIAVQTEDLGVMTADGLVLLGRSSDARLRGCSLDAETLEHRTGIRARF